MVTLTREWFGNHKIMQNHLFPFYCSMLYTIKSLFLCESEMSVIISPMTLLRSKLNLAGSETSMHEDDFLIVSHQVVNVGNIQLGTLFC